MAIFKHLADPIIHFSKAAGTSIYREDGSKIGKLVDFFVDYDDSYPQVVGLQYLTNKQSFYFLWEDLKYFSYKKVVVKKDSLPRKGRVFPVVMPAKGMSSLLAKSHDEKTKDFPPIGKLILDKQIVDMHGRKVVRVNDINFIKISNRLIVSHACIGLRSMIRRLGFEKSIDRLIRFFKPTSPYLTQERIITWKDVHTIPEKNSNLEVSIAKSDLSSFHPADLADILEELDNYGRERIFDQLDPEQKALTLSEIDHEFQSQLLEGTTPQKAAEIVENMDTDDAADFLNELGKEKAAEIISQIKEEEIKEEIEELLVYEEDTAGGLMTTEVFQIQENFNKSDVLSLLKEESDYIDSINNIYVVNEEEILLGICSLRQILLSGDEPISNYMIKEDIKFCRPEQSWKEIAQLMNKYNFVNIPVLNQDRKLLGAVSVDDVLPWLLNEK